MKMVSLTVVPEWPKWVKEGDEVWASLINDVWVWYVKVDGEWVQRDPQPSADDERVADSGAAA